MEKKINDAPAVRPIQEAPIEFFNLATYSGQRGQRREQRVEQGGPHFLPVMPGFMPGIHVFRADIGRGWHQTSGLPEVCTLGLPKVGYTRFAVTSPAMTQHGADNGLLRRYMTSARLVRAFGVSPVAEGRAMDAEHGPAGLEVRRRKLLFRAWHRGMRELDLILGRFADDQLAHLSPEELDELEHLMEVPDCDLFAWVMGQAPVHPEYDSPLWRRLRAFHSGRSSDAKV
jgi:antitoxin CptB